MYTTQPITQKLGHRTNKILSNFDYKKCPFSICTFSSDTWHPSYQGKSAPTNTPPSPDSTSEITKDMLLSLLHLT